MDAFVFDTVHCPGSFLSIGARTKKEPTMSLPAAVQHAFERAQQTDRKSVV